MIRYQVVCLNILIGSILGFFLNLTILGLEIAISVSIITSLILGLMYLFGYYFMELNKDVHNSDGGRR